MTRINLFRSKTFRTSPTLNQGFNRTTSTLIFAALLIACSLAVGCSSDKPKPVSSTPITQPALPVAPAAPATPALQATAKPPHKRVVHRASTVTYVDKTSGVSFQYPRKYALETGDAATAVVSSSPSPMDFSQPGGVALAAVVLPESSYPDSDLASAFFNVSINKTLTADQCGEFSVPQSNPAPAAESSPTAPAATQPVSQTQVSEAPVSEAPVTETPVSKPAVSKLMIGDLELQSAETSIAGETTDGPRQEAAKYFHVFQNGVCYEFALKVATSGVQSTPATESKSALKPIDRDQVFQHLEKILATVKIKTNSVSTPEVATTESQ